MFPYFFVWKNVICFKTVIIQTMIMESIQKELYEIQKIYNESRDTYDKLFERKKSLIDDHKQYDDELLLVSSQLEVAEIQVHNNYARLRELIKHMSVLKAHQIVLNDNHKIIKQLGKGSYGYVYLTVKDGNEFVVKITSSASVVGIPHEVDIMKRLQHIEGVPKLIEFYNKDNSCIIVMDYLPQSLDLLQWVVKQTGNVDNKKMEIFRKLVMILIDIDKAGFVHRDIKLENVVVVDANGSTTVRVIDFDHCVEKCTEPFTKFNGTVSYYPPEWFRTGQCRGEPMTVWSLGVLLYKMLTGYNPFPNVHKFDPGFERVGVHKSLLANLFKEDPHERISLVDIIKFC